MREIQVGQLTQVIRDLAIQANLVIGEDVIQSLKQAKETEESPVGKALIEEILENDRLAAEKEIPACQDTGVAVIFLEIGQDLHLVGGDLREAVNDGVRRGYVEGYLRKSVLDDPLARKNTGDNTPAMIHMEIVPGDRLRVTFMAKGGGSENMSALAMLPPSAGVNGVKKFVVEQVKKAGSNPCPPLVVGVGIGGNFDLCAYLSKKALLRPIGSVNQDPKFAQLEKELLEEINASGIGPQGLGGRTTALAVHIETYPCHITALPVAVNINCHASRVRQAEL